MWVRFAIRFHSRYIFLGTYCAEDTVCLPWEIENYTKTKAITIIIILNQKQKQFLILIKCIFSLETIKYNFKRKWNIKILMSEVITILKSKVRPLFSAKILETLHGKMQMHFTKVVLENKSRIIFIFIESWFFLAKGSGGYDLILSPNLSSGQKNSWR